MKQLNITLLGAMVMSSTVMAAPSAFEAKHCGPLNITNNTTSTVIRDHEDCSKVWVMPPEMGTVQTKNFKKSGNLGFCTELKNIQGATRRITNRIAALEDDIDRQTPSIRRAERKLRLAEEKLAAAKNTTIINEYNDLLDRLDTIEVRLEGIQVKLSECSSDCQALLNDYNDLRAEKKKINYDIRTVRRDNISSLRAYEKARSQHEAALRHFEFVNDEVLTIIEKKAQLHDRIFSLYKNYAKLEGGYISLNYDLNWDENVTALETAYPQYNFSKVATKDARIHANFIGSTDQDSYLASLPMILDYSIGGFEYQPYGVERDANISALPSEIQGDLRLSVVGACPYYYSNFLDDRTGQLQVNPNADTTQFGFGLSTSYKYPAVFKFNLEASYNLYKFYKKVVRSGSSGGLFSKKSWKKVSETKIDKDTFSIKWLDEGNRYSQDEKNKIRQTVKEELIARALQNMAEPAGARPTQMTAVNTFNPEPGALVVARGLEKTCGWYSYKCRAASWVLKGLTSIFGSARSEAEFQSTHDSTSTEIWNEENVVWRPGASSYVEK